MRLTLHRIASIIHHRWRLQRPQRLLLSLLLGLGITMVCLATRVSAAETVILQSQSLRLAVPLSELQQFGETGELSSELQNFLQQTQHDPDDVRLWLTEQISAGSQAKLPGDFVLIQINKTLGDPLGRENLDALRATLKRAFANSSFSVLELLEQYPDNSVRLELHRLEKVYTDVKLFVSRIEPVLSVIDVLLPELVCDCTVTPTASEAEAIAPTEAIAPQPYLQARAAAKSLWAIGASTEPEPIDVDITELLAAVDPSVYANKSLIFTFGPFRPSLSITELTRFVETGELSRGWQFYFNVAGVNRDELRTALAQQVDINLRILDRQLNTLPGEFLLYQVGQVIHPPSQHASIQALRSTLVLSTADDNRFSTLELLQNYPTSVIEISGMRLARMGKTISRIIPKGELTPTQVVTNAALDIEGWLLHLQASAAEDVCTCDAANTPSNPSVIAQPAPEVAAATVAQYLPTGWQPVAAHREDRGIIKVVWLQGTPYEMGYQHGQLLHDEIASLGTDAIAAVKLIGKALGFSRLAEKRTYPAVVEECRGLVAATDDLGINMDVCMMMAYADVFQEILGYTLPQELFWNGCNQFVAAGTATIDGRLYHGSSVDNDKKPVPYVINNPVIFVRQPTGALPHVFVTYPGVVWPNSGMNVAGISLGLDTAHPFSPDELSIHGRSNVQIMGQVLAHSTTFAEARAVMESQPRVRANLIMITDGKSQEAGVFEFTGKHLGVRSLQDNDILYVTNHFVLPEMYDKQALPTDASSVSRFERFQQLLEPDQPTSYHGQIDSQVMAQILRDRVDPYTGVASPLDVFDDNASPGGNGSLRQAIYDPQRLLVWVAAGQPPVPENPFECFSVGELLGFPNAAACQAPSL